MLEKTLPHYLALKFTEIVMSKVDTKIPVDPEIKDPNMRAYIDTTIEVHKVFYAFINKTYNDPNWTAPSVDITSLISSLVGLPQGQVGSLISGLVSKLLGGLMSSGTPK